MIRLGQVKRQSKAFNRRSMCLMVANGMDSRWLAVDSKLHMFHSLRPINRAVATTWLDPLGFVRLQLWLLKEEPRLSVYSHGGEKARQYNIIQWS